MTTEKLICSKQYYESLKALPPGRQAKEFNLCGYSINVFESDLFPYEIKYDACDIETKGEVKIPSGEFIHAMVVPADAKIELDPLIIEPPKMDMPKTYHWMINSWLWYQ